MGLVKRGKYWWLDIRIDGKRIRRSLQTTQKLEALDKYKIAKEELEEKYRKKKAGIRIEDFKKQYFDWVKIAKPASLRLEKLRWDIIQQFFREKGIEYLQDVKVFHIEQFRSFLLNKRKASKATCNRYLQLLKTAFYRARDWGLYESENPVAKIKLYRESKRPQSLTKDQVEEILKEAKRISEKPLSKAQECFYDILLIALNTGMRRSEIMKLKWKDIKGKELIIRGKGEKWRVVPINGTVKKILERRKLERQKDQEYVFDIPNRNYSGIFRNTFKRIKKATGINFHLHQLRHFFASELLRQGVDLQTISDILGHSTYYVSLLYTHTTKERQRKAVELMEELSSVDTIEDT